MGERGRWRPPRGRHRLPREMIARSQRERLLDAAVRCVAEKGYAATTVGDLTRLAGVSRTTFYEQFQDKEECCLAALDRAADDLISRVTAAFEGEERWPDRVRAGLATLLDTLAGDPAVARLALVGVGAAGPAAQRRQRSLIQRLTPLFEEGREFVPGARRLPANTSRMAVGGVAGLIADEVIAGRTSDLRLLQPDAVFAALTPYLGPAVAAKEAAQGAREQ